MLAWDPHHLILVKLSEIWIHKHADHGGTEVKTEALEGRSRRYAPKKEMPATWAKNTMGWQK